jgi:hypothetical protein
MNRLVCPLLLTVATAAPAAAMDQSLVKQFEKLDPQTRLEQRCDTEAMWKISADQTSFKPDKVIAYTFADPIVEADNQGARCSVSEQGRVVQAEIQMQHRTGPYRGAVIQLQDRRPDPA